MSHQKIDKILNEAASRPSHEPDPALLEKIAASIEPSLRPVRQLPGTWVLVVGLVVAGAAVAVLAAAFLGLHGAENLSVLQGSLLFPVFGALLCFASLAWVAEIIPGGRRWAGPISVLVASIVAVLVVFASVFHDYRVEHFLSIGIPCLLAGLLVAGIAALAGCLVARRGFAVNVVSAGLAGGTLAGLAGIVMLQLHCPNFQVPHVMFWHVAVVPISAGMGALVAWVFRSLNERAD